MEGIQNLHANTIIAFLTFSYFQLLERCQAFRDFLLARPEKRIAVVSHGRFLTVFTGEDKTQFNSFWNCDAREFVLSEDGTMSQGNVFLRVETWPWV